MKQSLVMIALALVVSCAAFAQTSNEKPGKDEKDKQELLRLDREWGEVVLRGDVATFDRIASEDHISTHSNGRIVTKAEEKAYLAKVSPSHPKIASIKTVDVDVRVYGDAAVIIGRIIEQIRDGGERQYRYTTTWVKRQNRWQVVAEQHTRIPEQQPASKP